MEINQKTSDTNLSKFISLILRHKPEVVGIQLSNDGYANTEELIEAINKNSKYNITMQDLERIVRTDNKQRYSFTPDKTKIRANQGHSIKNIDIGLTEITPPNKLYHGTSINNWEKIQESGYILPMQRQYVHLSSDLITAKLVGKRHGKPVLLEIDCKELQNQGQKFYISENKVYLTDKIDIEYVEKLR